MSKIRSVKNELNRLGIFLKHDREMAKILMMKDVYRLASGLSPSFRKEFERHMESYVGRLDRPMKTKIMGVDFFHRLRDFESLQDVTGSKDYGLMDDFLPKPGNYVIDAGAGVGEYTHVASLAVGREGKVISIEASSEPFAYLKKNSARSPLKNISAMKAALGEKKGSIRMFRPVGTSFVDSVKKDWSGPTFSYSVKSVTVDGIVRQMKLERLDLLKLDIEGSELSALAGAKETLRKLRPRIMIETHGEDLHSKVVEFLKKHGYRIEIEKIKFRKPFIAMLYASPR